MAAGSWRNGTTMGKTTIFDDLFAADLERLGRVPKAVGDHYGWR